MGATPIQIGGDRISYDAVTNEIITVQNTTPTIKFRLQEGSTTTYVAYFDGYNNRIPSPVNNLRIITSSTADITGRNNWYNLVPNADPVGNNIVPDEGAASKERYFRHRFNSGNNSLVNLFFKTNNTSFSEEGILGIYKSGVRTNLLKPGLNMFTIVSGISYLYPTSSIVLVNSQLENNSPSVPNATLVTDLDTDYFIIIKTRYNNSDSEDVQVAVEDGSGGNILLNYQSTQLDNYNIYEASGAIMSVTGGSIIEKYAINANDVRIKTLEDTALTKVVLANYTQDVTTFATQINNSVLQTTYDAKYPTIESNITAAAGRETVLESRYSAIENRITAVETDITDRVNTAIGTKVEETTYTALETELKGADSSITSILATLVVEEAQLAIDVSQDVEINSKLPEFDYKAKVSQIDNKNVEQDNLINSLVVPADFEAKVAAVEEYIKLFTATNEIILPTGELYVYDGTYQNIV
jgi:hypothetical protein